ncbi:unnamed protein product [Symbiodinium microadriaticum]|nr:unnamed protein product [Symbiodinium microadriaticum]
MQLKFTDNGWTGSQLRTGEGVLGFTVERMIPAGLTWAYEGAPATTTYGTWEKISGSFSLATNGDQILAYVGDDLAPFFVFGLSTVPWVTDGSTIDSSSSVLPAGLSDSGVNASIAFDGVHNGAYGGPTEGTRQMMLDSICNPLLWATSDYIEFPPGDVQDFQVYPSRVTATPTCVPTEGTGGDSQTGKNGGEADNGKYGTLSSNEFMVIVACLSVTLVVALFVGCRCSRYYKHVWRAEEIRTSLRDIPENIHHTETPLKSHLFTA